MAKLPFVVQPRLKPVIEEVGSETSGKIAIERRGYLSVAEKAFVQGAIGESGAQGRLYSLVARVAADNDKDPMEVMQELGAGGTPPEYLADHLGEFLAVMGELDEYNAKLRIFCAAALIISRIDSEFSVQDVMNLHPDILSGLHDLYNEEESKTLDRLEEAARREAEEASDSAGKSSEAS